ncbi:MAG: hypothetical protein ACRBG0_28355, partial [Lewinella sp.]|uniref:hypothetical protein n=1 Tax=Lewinella sp. TaxID=2004506 RepID=UPI003D6A0886
IPQPITDAEFKEHAAENKLSVAMFDEVGVLRQKYLDAKWHEKKSQLTVALGALEGQNRARYIIGEKMANGAYYASKSDVKDVVNGSHTVLQKFTYETSHAQSLRQAAKTVNRYLATTSRGDNSGIIRPPTTESLKAALNTLFQAKVDGTVGNEVTRSLVESEEFLALYNEFKDIDIAKQFHRLTQSQDPPMSEADKSRQAIKQGFDAKQRRLLEESEQRANSQEELERKYVAGEITRSEAKLSIVDAADLMAQYKEDQFQAGHMTREEAGLSEQDAADLLEMQQQLDDEENVEEGGGIVEGGQHDAGQPIWPGLDDNADDDSGRITALDIVPL